MRKQQPGMVPKPSRIGGIVGKQRTREESVDLFYMCRNSFSKDLERVAFSEFTGEQGGVPLQFSKFHPRRSSEESFNDVWKRL